MTAKKSAGNSVALTRPGRNGGTLRNGSLPGNTPGTGRPPNELRERMRGDLAETLPVALEIVRGKPMQQIEMPLLALLKHARCPRCEGRLKPIGETPELVTIGVRVSAKPRDRLSGLEFLARYGLGTKDEITMVSPDVVDRIRRTVQLIGSRKSWKSSEELLDHLEEIWK